MRRWLFVCSANITRSPTAAVLADLVALEEALEVEIRSAGTLGIEGEPAHRHMVAIARERGLDLSGHRSQGVRPELTTWADRIAVMTPHHAQVLVDMDDACADRIVQLGPLVGAHQIEDPTGAWFSGPYRTTFDELERAVRRFVADDAQRSTRGPAR